MITNYVICSSSKTCNVIVIITVRISKALINHGGADSIWGR